MSKHDRVRHSDDLRGMDLFTLESCRTPEGRALQGRFGLMFDLEPFAPPQRLLEELAEQMTAEEEPPDSLTLASGYTLFGQFITHDLTFDKTPLQEQDDDPLAKVNFRSPRFDLDSVYAKPPTSPEPPRDPGDKAKMKFFLDATTVHKIDDLPRQDPTKPDKGMANIGDRRNDENMLLAQLHLAFLKLHNVFVDKIDAGKTRPREPVFEEARERCQWYYQWLVVNDFLPRIVGQEMVDKILKIEDGEAHFDLRFYKSDRQ